VNLVAPDRVTRTLYAGERAPGVYRFTWAGTTSTGGPEAEGQWRLSVTAVDDQNQTSTTDRLFSLNRTLGSLTVPASVGLTPRGGRVRATYSLARGARVTVNVETVSGALIRTLYRGRSLAAGTQSATWNGRDERARVVHRGRYAIRVLAVNEVGAMDLMGQFTVRR
jgi:flagellar hook assembly protein FlgD